MKRPDAKPYVLAIDLGSGGFKVAVVAHSGQIMGSAKESITTYLLPGGGAEQDPEEWWIKAKSAAKRAIHAADVCADDIIAIACDSQWSVAVPVNEHCEPLMRAVHWMDTRGAPYNRKITKGFVRIQGYGLLKLLRWIRSTGLVPTHSGIDSLGHVLFIKNELPEIYARTHKFLEPMDFLTSRLTGKITASQKTMSPFMVVSNKKWGSRQYSPELLNLAGVPQDKFPDLIPNDGIVGTVDPGVARELELQPATQVVAGIGDSNASAIGSGAVMDFEPLIYIGTSLYLTCHVPFKKTDLRHFMTSLPSPFKSKYYLFGEQGAGGKGIEFFLKNIVYPEDAFETGPQPEDAYRHFSSLAAQTPAGSGGVIFLPWLNGSIVPCEDPHVRGGFLNVSLQTKRSDLARAIMEGLAYNSRWTGEAAQKFIGCPIQSYRFAGGGALSDVWSQIHADILGVPIHQVDDPLNATVRGTALLALISLGHRSLEEIPDLVKIKQIFRPDNSSRTLYDKMYTQFREIFHKNRKIFAALNTA